MLRRNWKSRTNRGLATIHFNKNWFDKPTTLYAEKGELLFPQTLTEYVENRSNVSGGMIRELYKPAQSLKYHYVLRQNKFMPTVPSLNYNQFINQPLIKIKYSPTNYKILHLASQVSEPIYNLISLYDEKSNLFMASEHPFFQQKQTKNLLHTRNFFYYYHKVRFVQML